MWFPVFVGFVTDTGVPLTVQGVGRRDATQTEFAASHHTRIVWNLAATFAISSVCSCTCSPSVLRPLKRTKRDASFN